MLPDPELNQEAEVEIIGGAGECSAAHDTNVETSESSMLLNWTHTAGTHIDKEDIIYFYQEFDWPYERMPSDVIISLNYSIDVKGDFADVGSNLGWRWFQGHYWLIDSSGEWTEILHTDGYPSSQDRSFKNKLSYWAIAGAWRGMIEDQDGIQQDPQDVLRVAVGFSPTEYFESDGSHTPWDDFSGSVSMNTTSFELYIIESTEPDPSDYLSPSFNQSWFQHMGDYYPGHEIWNESVAVFFDDYLRTDDGSIYVLSSSMTGYQWYQQYGLYTSYQYLQKYDSSLNLMWTQRNVNRSQGLGLAYYNNHLYSVGFIYTGDGRDALITKWTLDGQRVWQSTWNGGFYETGIDVVVDSDDTVYAICEYTDYSEDGFSKSMLLKFDSNGELLWNHTYQYSFYENCRLVLYDDHIYALGGAMVCFDKTGALEWEGSAYGQDWAYDGGLFYAYQRTEVGFDLVAYDGSGSEVWTSTYHEEDVLGWQEQFYVHDIALKPNGNIVILHYGTVFHDAFQLLEFSSTGNLLDLKYIGAEYWPYGTALQNQLLFVDDSSFYIGHTVATEEGYCLGIEAYGMERILPLPLIPIVIGGIIGLVVVIIVVIRKRR